MNYDNFRKKFNAKLKAATILKDQSLPSLNPQKSISDPSKILSVIPEGKSMKGTKHAFMNGGKTSLPKPPVRASSYELLKLGSSKSISTPTQSLQVFSPSKGFPKNMERVMSITENGLLKTLMNTADKNRAAHIKASLTRLTSDNSK